MHRMIANTTAAILRTAKSPLSTILVRGLSIALKTIQVLVLIRIFGPNLYGVFVVCLGIFTLAMVFGRLGLDHFTLREANGRDRSAQLVLVGISLLIALPCSVAALAALGFVRWLYPSDLFIAFLFFAAASPFYAVMWNLVYILRGMGRINTSLLILEVLHPILMLCLAWMLQDVPLGLSVSFLGATIVASIISCMLMYYFMGCPKKRELSATIFLSAISKSRHFYQLSVLDAAQALSDSLMVGFLLQPADVTKYAVITRIGGVVVLPVSLISIYMNNVVAQRLSHSVREILSALRTHIIYSIASSAAISLLALALIPYIEFIFDLEFGVEAKVSYVAYVFAQLIYGLSAFNRSILYMSKRERYIGQINLFSLGPYIVALIYSIPLAGLPAAAVAYLGHAIVTSSLMAGVLLRECRRETSVRK